MQNLAISLGLLGLFALAGCKKETRVPSRTELLTASNWRISAHTTTLSGSGQPVLTDVYATYPACDRDDFVRFSADNSLLLDQGVLKCNPQDAQTRGGKWRFNSDETTLEGLPTVSAYLSLLGPADIIELSATTLHIRFTPLYSYGSTPSSTQDFYYTSF